MPLGKGRAASDSSWKDPLLVWPGETVRVAIDFAHDFPGSQTTSSIATTSSTTTPE